MRTARQRILKVAFAALFVLLATGGLEVWARGETVAGWWAYYGVYVLGSALVVSRAVAVPRARGAWSAIAAGMVLYTLGTLYSARIVYFGAAGFGLGEIAVPSLADGLWLAFYPLVYLGLGLLLRQRVHSVPHSVWLDAPSAGSPWRR